MAYGESTGHVIDDVTWPWKVKVNLFCYHMFFYLFIISSSHSKQIWTAWRSFRMTTKWFCMTWQYRTNGDKSLNRRYNDGSIFIQLRARFTNVDQISVQLNQVQRWVCVNTTSAPSHRRPVFVDCHSRRLGIDRECTHSLHRNDMA